MGHNDIDGVFREVAGDCAATVGRGVGAVGFHAVEEPDGQGCEQDETAQDNDERGSLERIGLGAVRFGEWIRHGFLRAPAAAAQWHGGGESAVGNVFRGKDAFQPSEVGIVGGRSGEETRGIRDSHSGGSSRSAGSSACEAIHRRFLNCDHGDIDQRWELVHLSGLAATAPCGERVPAVVRGICGVTGGVSRRNADDKGDDVFGKGTQSTVSSRRNPGRIGDSSRTWGDRKAVGGRLPLVKTEAWSVVNTC